MPTLSFSEALEIRYVEDIDVSPIEPCEIFLVGSFPGRSSPSGRLVLPRTLTLNCCEIDRAGTLRKIEELCHNVEELDLAQNQLCDLNEVLINLVLFTDIIILIIIVLMLSFSPPSPLISSVDSYICLYIIEMIIRIEK